MQIKPQRIDPSGIVAWLMLTPFALLLARHFLWIEDASMIPALGFCVVTIGMVVYLSATYFIARQIGYGKSPTTELCKCLAIVLPIILLVLPMRTRSFLIVSVVFVLALIVRILLHKPKLEDAEQV